MDEFIGESLRQLERVGELCHRVGLTYVELPRQIIGVGLAVGFGPEDYAVLAIGAGTLTDRLFITGGVLKDIRQDRLGALEVCNRFTQSNSMFPVFLHDAEAGWAIILQQTHVIDVLVASPDFFAAAVSSVPHVVQNCRREIGEKHSLGGSPWEWTPHDHKDLLTRSVL